MLNKIIPKEQGEARSNHQQLFTHYTMAVLIDLTVLNLFNEYWVHVTIDAFSTSLIAAILLQVLLKLTLKIEHRIAQKFESKPGLKPKVMRVLSAWAIIFISKIIILEAINIAFGDAVLFTGPIHGLVVFIVVVTGILVAEQIVLRIYKSLA